MKRAVLTCLALAYAGSGSADVLWLYQLPDSDRSRAVLAVDPLTGAVLKRLEGAGVYEVSVSAADPKTLHIVGWQLTEAGGMVVDIEQYVGTEVRKSAHLELATLPVLPITNWPVAAVTFPDTAGDRIAILHAASPPRLSVYETGTGKRITDFEMPIAGSAVPYVFWAADGASLAIVDPANGAAYIYDLATSKQVARHELFAAAEMQGAPSAFGVAQAAGGEILALSNFGAFARCRITLEATLPCARMNLWSGLRNIGNLNLARGGGSLYVPLKEVSTESGKATNNLLVADVRNTQGEAAPSIRYVSTGAALHEAIGRDAPLTIFGIEESGTVSVLDGRTGALRKSFAIGGTIAYAGYMEDGAEPAAAPAAASTAREPSAAGGSRINWTLAGIVLLALVVIGAIVIGRRRRRRTPADGSST